MKKYIIACLAASLLSGCVKDPDKVNLLDNNITYFLRTDTLTDARMLTINDDPTVYYPVSIQINTDNIENGQTVHFTVSSNAKIMAAPGGTAESTVDIKIADKTAKAYITTPFDCNKTILLTASIQDYISSRTIYLRKLEPDVIQFQHTGNIDTTSGDKTVNLILRSDTLSQLSTCPFRVEFFATDSPVNAIIPTVIPVQVVTALNGIVSVTNTVANTTKGRGKITIYAKYNTLVDSVSYYVH